MKFTNRERMPNGTVRAQSVIEPGQPAPEQVRFQRIDNEEGWISKGCFRQMITPITHFRAPGRQLPTLVLGQKRLVTLPQFVLSYPP